MENQKQCIVSIPKKMRVLADITLASANSYVPKLKKSRDYCTENYNKDDTNWKSSDESYDDDEDCEKFQCKQCHKAFKHRNSLIYHIDTVHEGLNYKCNKCEKSFTSKNSLNDHVRSIHEKIGQNCEICNKTVASAAGLRFHIKTVHGK